MGVCDTSNQATRFTPRSLIAPNRLSKINLLRFGNHACNGANRATEHYPWRTADDANPRTDPGARKPAILSRRATTRQ